MQPRSYLVMEQEIVSILAILFGVLVIAVPDLIGILVGIFLIIYGILTLLGRGRR